jgi:hypothetical protein
MGFAVNDGRRDIGGKSRAIHRLQEEMPEIPPDEALGRR